MRKMCTNECFYNNYTEENHSFHSGYHLQRHVLGVFCQSDLIQNDNTHKLLQILTLLELGAQFERVDDTGWSGVTAALE